MPELQNPGPARLGPQFRHVPTVGGPTSIGSHRGAAANRVRRVYWLGRDLADESDLVQAFLLGCWRRGLAGRCPMGIRRLRAQRIRMDSGWPPALGPGSARPDVVDGSQGFDNS